MMCENIDEKVEFSFDELSEEAKEKARKEIRNSPSYLDWDWWEYEYAYWTAKLAEVGITVDRIYFSGFWSQGDGACFEGSIRGKDMATFIAAQKLAEAYPVTAKMALEHGGVGIDISHSGHYYHKYCARFSIDLNRFEYHVDTNNCPVREAVVTALDEKLEEEAENFEEAVTEICRNYMQEIYDALEAEYEGYMSDESIDDHLIANNYLFDADGSIL